MICRGPGLLYVHMIWILPHPLPPFPANTDEARQGQTQED
jgi:hypothetical protein